MNNQMIWALFFLGGNFPGNAQPCGYFSSSDAVFAAVNSVLGIPSTQWFSDEGGYSVNWTNGQFNTYSLFLDDTSELKNTVSVNMPEPSSTP